ALGNTEYRLSHIAVETAEAATALIEQLNKGANFANLARDNSLDNNTKAQGGDLDWVAPTAMPPSFAVAVRELKKGDHSKTPLRSELAWHVIRVTDTRDLAPPAFDGVRDQLVQAVQQKQFEAWVDGLVTKAKITKTP